jgi:uncharacterized membrane protein YkvA (DUF1232 family)
MLQQQVATVTFEQARISAELYVGHEEKLRCLLEKATRKSEKCYEFLLAPWESLQIFLRLLRAHLVGKFHAPPDSILMIIAAVIYFVSPFDLIPDSIPVLGLIDDAAVITFVAKANLTLISNFRTWEILRDRNFGPSMKYRTKKSDQHRFSSERPSHYL